MKKDENKMSNNPTILILNRNKKNIELMDKVISPQGYEIQGSTNLNELKDFINTNKKIDLVLIDLTGFDRRIWEECENLRENKIPFLIISPQKHIQLHEESIKHGAEDFLVKPLVVKEMVTLINEFLKTDA
ncbi:MAG: response regulator [Methanobacterium sp.]|nr:response regulator [Methanobacterium sp.]